MTTIVQVCGCADIDGEVNPLVPDCDAKFYGVYIGKDGPPFEWVADFQSKTDAVNWAEEVAECHDGVIEDKTYTLEELCKNYQRP